ncbi:MAG: DUF4199 domain-containing protein [Saprospiraceae bacterium]
MLNHPALKWGLIYGFFFVILNTIFQFVAPKMIFTGTLTTILTFAVPIACMVMAGREIREMQDGFLSFGEGVKITFLVWAIGSLISLLHQYFQVNFFDPTLIDVQKEVVAEAGQWMSEMFGLSEEMQDQMNDQLEAAAEEIEHQTFGQAIVGWMGGCIIGLIISLIVSAIIKKSY